MDPIICHVILNQECADYSIFLPRQRFSIPPLSPRQNETENRIKVKMLTVAKIAVRLKVEHKTVRNLIKSGRLRAVRLGRLLRIREADYEAFLEASYV